MDDGAVQRGQARTGSDSGDSDCGFAAERLLLGVTAPHCSSHASMYHREFGASPSPFQQR